MKKLTRNNLTVKQKVDIVSQIRKGRSHTAVARDYHVSRQCISKIWMRKNVILQSFQDGRSELKKLRPLKYMQIDSELLIWFKRRKDQKLPVGGTILIERAKAIAKELSIDSFVASNGWLDSWKKRHNITFRSVTEGEEKPEKIDVKEEHNDYATIDEDLISCEISSIEEIIPNQINTNASSGESNSKDCPDSTVQISTKEFITALDLVINYMKQKSETDYNSIIKLLSNIKEKECLDSVIQAQLENLNCNF